jgi:glycopeptide antibiotics resistance protein
MRRTHLIVLVSWLYIVLLLTGLLLPRKTSSAAAPISFIKKIFHEILFLSGPPEIVLNFVLFIPLFLTLSYLAPRLARPHAALIACLTSAAAELAQSQIPGRVSSWRDLISNCLGVLIALAVTTRLSHRMKSLRS